MIFYICKILALLFIGLGSMDQPESPTLEAETDQSCVDNQATPENEAHEVFVNELFPILVERITDDTSESLPGGYWSLAFLSFLIWALFLFSQKRGNRFQHLYLLYCSWRMGETFLKRGIELPDDSKAFTHPRKL
jgi:hypothetical protein